MERDQNRRSSKSASGFEGLPQVQKHRTVSRLPLDSGSHVNAGIRNDTSLEIRESSYGRATERPSANLLAGRMYQETEPKRRSLIGIARLLRREGLPSLWNVHKQKKRLLDSHRLSNTSINVEPNRQLYDGQSSRRSPKKQQESKDVYEDLDEPSFVNGRYSSRWDASAMLSKSEMALIQQNLDSKRLTYDETITEKLQDSEELDDTLDMLDSRDLMMQFGRKKKSSGNIEYDQRGTSSSSVGSPTALLNPPVSAKYGNAKSRRADKDITGKHNIAYLPNSDDGLLLDPHYRHRARIDHKLSDIQLKEKNKKSTLPTPIMVLKPNLGDMQNDSASPYHSQGYFPNSAKMTGCPTLGKELSWRKTKSYYDAEFLTSEEARKLANKITRRLRDACEESEDATYSRLRKYVVDSYGTKNIDIDSDLGMFKSSSRGSFVDDNERRRSSRSVNEEAKKRLAERRRVTHKYRDLEIVGKGSTLDEMLSIPDGEKRSKQTAYERIDRSCSQVCSNYGSSIRHGLSGTISRGGSKNKTERTSRSRSVPPIDGNIRGRGACHGMLADEKHLLHSEPISHGTSKVTKQHPSHKDHFSSQGSNFSGKKPLPCPPIYIEEIDSSLGARFEIQMEANVKALPYQQLTFQMAEKDDCSGSDVPEIVAADAEHGITTLLSRTSLMDPNHSPVDNESSSSTAHGLKDFCLQELQQEVSEQVAPSSNYLAAELVSSESSKDADYVSPVSVLQTPSVKDASSSSESSERVSAEVSELRMMLQLLKMETEAYDNVSTHPIEKDATRAEGWEASYILDVLIQAGLHDFGFDLFRIMWHSPDYPLDSRLLDILEEKYCSEMAGSRLDRMLLFDRINSALSEIFLKYVDVCPWVMSELDGSMHFMWQKERARSTVEKLINRASANGLRVTERILNREVQWPDPTEEIALTGNEIERLLMDDLINEILFEQL